MLRRGYWNQKLEVHKEESKLAPPQELLDKWIKTNPQEYEWCGEPLYIDKYFSNKTGDWTLNWVNNHGHTSNHFSQFEKEYSVVYCTFYRKFKKFKYKEVK